MKKLDALKSMRAARAAGLVACAVVLAATPGTPLEAAAALPRTPPDHIVIVVMENRAPEQIIGSDFAPYMSELAKKSAVFTQSFAIAHPSQPNYLALFSGSTQGVTDNRCLSTIRASSLGQQLVEAHKTFVGYAEGIPKAGYLGCTAPSGYVAKHAPWVSFALAPATSQPMTAFPQGRLERLPTVSMVIPNLNDDMHDGPIADGDAWLKTTLDGYVHWADTHNAMLIVTFDEDDGNHGNRIPTWFYGPMVKPGIYATRITHYDVLRTIEALYGLPYLGEAARGRTIDEVWK